MRSEPSLAQPLFDRRRWLATSALGAASSVGLASLAPTARASERPSTTRERTIRSCILIFHYGGPSHLETFDPKPEAPVQIRGEYDTIPTSVPGILLGEHLPRTARLVDRMAIVRSVHHPMRNHNSAAAETLTGRTPAGGDLELLADESRSFPTIGSTVAYALGASAHVLPYVALPYTMYNVVQLPGQTPGILGGAFDRFQVQGDPNAPNFHLSALDLHRNGSEMSARAELLEQLDLMRGDRSVSRMQTYQERALALLSSAEVRRSFDISAERPETRDRYGRNLLGQCLLLSRRLVEGGVNFVSVFNGQHNGQEANWDSHTNLFVRHKQLLGPADLGYSALIEDLEQRGLLESTLVVSLSEFGRTPKVNGSAGRDHWPDCFSVTFAGGGVQGGTVFGASDKIGAYPDRDGVRPSDLVATILWRFGISSEIEMHDQTSRPFRLADGQPLTGLFG